MSAIKLNNITVYCGSNFGEIPIIIITPKS